MEERGVHERGGLLLLWVLTGLPTGRAWRLCHRHLHLLPKCEDRSAWEPTVSSAHCPEHRHSHPSLPGLANKKVAHAFKLSLLSPIWQRKGGEQSRTAPVMASTWWLPRMWERILGGHLELIGHSLPSQHLPVTSQNKSLSKIDGTPCVLNCWGMTVDTKPRLWLLCGHFYSDQPFPILAGAF